MKKTKKVLVKVDIKKMSGKGKKIIAKLFNKEKKYSYWVGYYRGKEKDRERIVIFENHKRKMNDKDYEKAFKDPKVRRDYSKTSNGYLITAMYENKKGHIIEYMKKWNKNDKKLAKIYRVEIPFSNKSYEIVKEYDLKNRKVFVSKSEEILT